jgi:hypothetical protein
MTEKTIQDLIARIEKLERAVFGQGKEKTKAKNIKDRHFSGATGGLRLLISTGFFDRKRAFSEIEAELLKHGYNYSKQAVQTPLNRLSKTGGPLVGFKEKGKKVYAKRK